MRVQAIGDVAKVVQRDGEAVAMRHGVKTPEDGVSGSRIVSMVNVPPEAVIVTGASVEKNTQIVVAMLHAKHAGWLIIKHRVMLTDSVTGETLKASPWDDGAWDGDCALSEHFDPDMPPEANAA